jgi:hypothetical protein
MPAARTLISRCCAGAISIANIVPGLSCLFVRKNKNLAKKERAAVAGVHPERKSFGQREKSVPRRYAVKIKSSE